MTTLSEAELARIASNREKAKHLRAAKLIHHPYGRINSMDRTNQKEGEAGSSAAISTKSSVLRTKLIDSGGGFLIEKEIIPETNGNDDSAASSSNVPVFDDAMELPPTYEKCLECDDSFVESWLLTNFAYSVCDKCRNSDDRHSLITRTEAKNEYLLKDCDLDRREPPLKYIERQNPHNVRWGTMKLYLHLLVEKRALEVWGSEENLMEQLALRDEKRDKAKHKKYNKNMKQLRMEMRSSLFDGRTAKGPHTHEYGEETYNEDDDNYTHTCTVCGFVETYEKM